jgi:hypothetical protein
MVDLVFPGFASLLHVLTAELCLSAGWDCQCHPMWAEHGTGLSPSINYISWKKVCKSIGLLNNVLLRFNIECLENCSNKKIPKINPVQHYVTF